MPLILILLLSSLCFASDWQIRESEVLSGPGEIVQCVRKRFENGTEMYLLKADMRRCGLRVIPEARPRVAEALERAGCVAGVNGGYFHPGGEPLGLVMAGGASFHKLEQAKLLSGLVVYAKDRATLLRVKEFDGRAQEALQAGPFLVDGGRLVSGLNATKRAARTVALSDGKNNFGLVVCYSPTLREMGSILSDPAVISEMKVMRALNLDGGSSTAFWIKSPKISHRELKSVTNAIGFAPKPPGL